MTRWASRLAAFLAGVVVMAIVMRVFRAELRPRPETTAAARAAVVTPPVNAAGPDAGEAPLVEAVGEAPPDCLGRVAGLAQPFHACVHDPANRDCGVRFAFSRACEPKQILPWGNLDDETRACLVAWAKAIAHGTPAAPVWFVDYPLGDPAFIAPVDGIGEPRSLRRGLPKAAAAMKGVASVALGPRRAAEKTDSAATFGGHRYRLRTVGGPMEHPYAPGLLALESDGRTQVLRRDIQDVRVRWAGDVDADGRLDLLLQSTTTAFGHRFDLYLSGGAGGRLVRLAALDEDDGD